MSAAHLSVLPAVDEFREPWVLDLRRLGAIVAAGAFLLLFPGFLLYHYAVSSGWLAPVLGGLFRYVVVVTGIYCVLCAPWLLSRQIWGGNPACLAFLMCWCFFLIWTLCGLISIAFEDFVFLAFGESGSMLVIWLVLFFVGYFFPAESRKQKALLGAACLGIAAILIHAAASFGGILGPYVAFRPSEGSAAVSTYQGAGRSLLVAGVVLAGLCRRQQLKIVTLVVTVLALLLIGSRTYFLASLAVALSVTGLTALRELRLGTMIVAFASIGLGVWVAGMILPDTRVFELLDLASSTSWQSRLELQSIALRVIGEAPLLGDFSYHLRELGTGGYAHNAFSAWTQFGLAGFIIYCGLLLSFMVIACRGVFTIGRRDIVWQIAFMLNVAGVLTALAEPVMSVIPPLAWGFTSRALRRRVNRRVVLIG